MAKSRNSEIAQNAWFWRKYSARIDILVKSIAVGYFLFILNGSFSVLRSSSGRKIYTTSPLVHAKNENAETRLKTGLKWFKVKWPMG